MRLGTYVISQGDVIEILAKVLTGNSRQVDTLININQLRYPYISDDPFDQFANPKGTVTLTSSYTNPTTVTITNTNNIVILVNDTIVFSEGSNFGSGVVQSVSGSTITFVSSVTGAFDAGAIVTIFSNQQNVKAQVLRTGDTLLYPSDGNPSNPVTMSQNNYNLFIGTDWQLDSNGYLSRVNRDIGKVLGLNNLTQAINMRMRTAFGAFRRNYGNRIFNILGESSTSYFIGLAKNYAVECVKQDPRVANVKVIDFSVLNDKMYITLSVYPKGSQDAVSMPITIPIGGVN